MKVNILRATMTIDELDEEFVKGCSWSVTWDGYARTTIRHKTYFLHRLVMEAKKGQIVDHINGDKLDNRRVNLRFATQSQNMMNRGKTIRNTSGYKGVTKVGKKWKATMGGRKRLRYIGIFDTKEEAAMAYAKVAKEVFGEFAKID